MTNSCNDTRDLIQRLVDALEHWQLGCGSTAADACVIQATRAYLAAHLEPAADGPAVPGGREPASVVTEPTDLSHLSDDEFNALCPQGCHATGNATPEPAAGLPPSVGHILRLAEIIRKVDGNHSLGAAALAEAILSHPGSRWQPISEPAAGPTDEEVQQFLCNQDRQRREHESPFDGPDFDGTRVRVERVADIRAALSRWGHQPPRPIPLSKRLPTKADCDAKGRFWLWAYKWELFRLDWLTTHCLSELIASEKWGCAAWLPYDALPLPGTQS